MSYNLILQSVAKHISLSPNEIEVFTSLLTKKTIRAKKLFLREGEVCMNSAFVTGGCMRSYTIDNNGFEHILAFAPSGWWIGDLYSLITAKPCILNIEAIKDTELLLLSKANQELLYNTIPTVERFFRKLAENSLVAFHERTIHYLSCTAVERYEKFCQTYPELIKTLPQKHIAAYIGVTPEFFSRMLKNLLKEK